ncbi:Uncharacterised protein [Legionella busanensis]|uniref:NadR/Ttd14 AAA domain-containing protein n=1 Tax=Legionella busanensis TaxID=190655 RepID=A0A378JV26_9GAMM|nr:AAA family ATPase [Legionella busanensis]STX52062.1 Uncharacterised protein [Legionella busanensis]
MRIAVSGTHSVGKSTFVKDFLYAYPDYKHEEEPYRVLREFYDIKFGNKSTRFHNGIQLYYNITRVQSYLSSLDNVIFDRCPIDYIAYSLYTANHKQTDINLAFVEGMIEPVLNSLKNLDLILFIPITEKHLIEIEDDGIRPTDQSYRNEVDAIFKSIYREKLFGIMSQANLPKVIEIWGTREQRITQVSDLLNEEK